MENKDLKSIEHLFGKSFANLCKNLFEVTRKNEEIICKTIIDSFAPNFELYKDIVENNCIKEFKEYINILCNNEKRENSLKKTSKELFDEAGYILYPECKTEKEIKKFKKYYVKGEELEIFNGGSLKGYRVWFAVKKNADKLKREDFKEPKIQDDYSTSVINILYDRGLGSQILIQNRYNDLVSGSIFDNNLDNIKEGLKYTFVEDYGINLDTEMFARDYGHHLDKKYYSLSIPNYVQSVDGKLYKYNLKSYKTYFCNDNVIIDDGRVLEFDKNRFLVFENFILDLKNKKIHQYLNKEYESANGNLETKDFFPKSIGKIEKLEIKSIANNFKKIIIKPENLKKNVIIFLNNNNEIIGYSNPNVKIINSVFLNSNIKLEYLNLPNVEEIKNYFCCSNLCLKDIILNNVKKIGNSFLYSNEILENIKLPKVKTIGNYCLCKNTNIKVLNLPEVENIGNCCLINNEIINKLNIPKVKKIGVNFCYSIKTNNIVYNFCLDNNSKTNFNKEL